MTLEILKRDNRLFLFQTVEYGLRAKLMEDVLLDEFRKDGVKMAFVFAKRYYSVVYEAYLRQASYCVLGIINLGLIESSDNRLENAVDLLLKKGFVGSFREGWSRISRLVRYVRACDPFHQKTAFEWEKDFSESVSAEPGRKWIGYDEFRYLMSLYGKGDRIEWNH